MSKETILDQFKLYSSNGEGIAGWLTEGVDTKIFDRLDSIDNEPLTQAQLNQLLALAQQPTVSDGYFYYYWLESPPDHPYSVQSLPTFRQDWLSGSGRIKSLSHLEWGLHRIFVDGLLYFGNIDKAYRSLRNLSREELVLFFRGKRIVSESFEERGTALPIEEISRDDRYYISESVHKSLGSNPGIEGTLHQTLIQAYDEHVNAGGGTTTFDQLIRGGRPSGSSAIQGEFRFIMEDVLDDSITSRADFDEKFSAVFGKFHSARQAALRNTTMYLSVVNELDVYVATSMRTREDFRGMARFCGDLFNDSRLMDLNLRYFDPTLSAASGPEDKGLIECLMVKCAKALVYVAGSKESYGKDVEAAMALSLGKPVIFYCGGEAIERANIYRDVHPLSRLIQFETGVAVGAMVTTDLNELATLLSRIFRNNMQYILEEHPATPGYLILKDELTNSVVRLQTSDRTLSQTFWNHYGPHSHK